MTRSLSASRLIDAGLEILDDNECVRLLNTARIGRVAVTIGGGAVVLPVNFVMLGSDIMFFTGAGTKLNAALRGATVTFEVDDFDVDARAGWSVLAMGRAERTGGELRPRVEAMGLCPWAAGDRHNLVRIRPAFFSGRRIAGRADGGSAGARTVPHPGGGAVG